MSGAAASPEVCPGRGEAETSAAADDDEPRAPRTRRVVVHATAVAWHGRGVLLRGPSGSGKSALALRLLHAGAVLVAALTAVGVGALVFGPYLWAILQKWA